MKRIVLLIATNIGVLIVLSAVIQLLGLDQEPAPADPEQ